MPIETVPEWMAGLEEEDVAFVRRFVLASGSLKEVAGGYGVTYPTVRLRLDRLIQKIHLSEDTAADPYIALIKRLAVNEKLDLDTAKVLISAYKKTKGERCLPIRKHRGAREKRYSFGYAVFLILALMK